MAIQKQLSVFLANRPGAISRVGAAFKEAGINITGLCVADASDHAVVRMIVDLPHKAIAILEDRGVLVLEEDLLEVTLSDEPGAFADFAAVLAEEGINIDYAYGSMPKEAAAVSTLFLHVSDVTRAENVLQKHDRKNR